MARIALYLPAGTREREADQSGWRQLYLPPIAVFAVTRAWLLVLGWYAPRLLPGPRIRANAPVLPPSDILYNGGNWTRPWFRFDTKWYVGIVQHGYHWGSLGKANTNFMPLYPAAVRAMQPFAAGSVWLAAWIAANAALLIALMVLWRWGLARFGKDQALRALLLVVFFPFAFFLSTPYAESLFLAAAAATFLFAEEGRWNLAFTAAAMGAITRPIGLALVAALVLLAWDAGERRRALLAPMTILPLAVFITYLTVAFRQPLAFLTYHSGGWVPPHGGIVATLSSQFHTYLSPFDRVDAALAVLFLVSGVIAWKKLGRAYGAYVLMGVLLPLVHGLVSMERYVVVLFPAMALWATIRNRAAQTVIFSVSVLGCIVATVMFATGYTLV